MWLRIQSEDNLKVDTEVSNESQIRQAVMQCCSGELGDGWIMLLKGETNWIESDGKNEIIFRQGSSGVFIYEGPMEADVLLDVFLGFFHRDEAWKEFFPWRWEDRDLYP